MTDWVLQRGFEFDAADLERTIAHHATLEESLDRLRSVVFPPASAAAQPATITSWIETNR